jgi:cellulose synthase (UDP-forming)
MEVSKHYLTRYEDRMPAPRPITPRWRMDLWHFMAGTTIALALQYSVWRWTETLNPAAPVFSAVVAAAETLVLVGTILFFFDIWDEADTPASLPPATRSEAGLDPNPDPIRVDIFIATYNEPESILVPTITDALAIAVPANVTVVVHLLDDGARPEVAALAAQHGIPYLKRPSNRGFKAGNLRNALLHSNGDFIVICDADTRLFKSFLVNTLGYFREPDVAWVQTPHWFYDIPAWSGPLGPLAKGHRHTDPFLVDPDLFFDVIQRRRNRNNASFCCGAASIHRREPLVAAALGRQALQVRQQRSALGLSGAAPSSWALANPAEPFKFHVSEDLFTSILLHSESQGWRSVFHPQVESRMLSPWSLEAWSIQQFKYSAGTFDILFHENPLFHSNMPLKVRLHYAATFCSYFSIVWTTILLLSPIFALLTGYSPISANLGSFLIHFIPLIVVNEIALGVGLKGYSPSQGRILSQILLPLQWRALVSVLRGKRPKFPVTPKVPDARVDLRYVRFHLCFLALGAAALGKGWHDYFMGVSGYEMNFVLLNGFWLLRSLGPMLHIVAASAFTGHLQATADQE